MNVCFLTFCRNAHSHKYERNTTAICQPAFDQFIWKAQPTELKIQRKSCQMTSFNDQQSYTLKPLAAAKHSLMLSQIQKFGNFNYKLLSISQCTRTHTYHLAVQTTGTADRQNSDVVPRHLPRCVFADATANSTVNNRSYILHTVQCRLISSTLRNQAAF